MKSLQEYSKENLIEEGLFGIHIPSMEEIALYIMGALAVWEVIKFGGRCTMDFIKTFFTGKTKFSKTFGEILGEKLHKKITSSIKNAIKDVSPKQFTKELIQLKKDLSTGNISTDDVKEKMFELVKKGGKLTDDDIAEICKELEEFTKDEQRVKKLADALNIKL